MGAYKRDVVAVIKMGAWGAYFVWMPITQFYGMQDCVISVICCMKK